MVEIDFGQLIFGEDFRVYWYDYDAQKRKLQDSLRAEQAIQFGIL
jgi:hypothetical protein